MSKTVPAIPEGYQAITPGFATPGCSKAIAFYTKVFGAEQTVLFAAPDGSVVHCEMRIGGARFMFGEPMGREAYTMRLMLYVPDSDAVFKRAVDAGATAVEQVKDHFYGARGGRVIDPFGNHWFIATHKEDVAPDELDRRFAALLSAPETAG